MSHSVLLLLSGGIDSPVAARLIQDQHGELQAVHFASKFVGRNPEEKCKDICTRLHIPTLHILNASPAFESIAKHCTHELYFVLMKRFMVRCAEQFALAQKISYLATGESLGQVSSQTLTHLGIIQSAVTLPILRPLLVLDKEEIIRLAKKFNTFEISIGPESCDLLGAKHPSTHTPLNRILEEEQKLNYSELIQSCLTSHHTISIASH